VPSRPVKVKGTPRDCAAQYATSGLAAPAVPPGQTARTHPPKGNPAMPKFDALAVVEPLEFDFNPHLDLRGTIVEPSEDRLGAFFEAMVAVQKGSPKALKGIDTGDPEKMVAALGKLPEGSLAAMLARLNKPYADLCGGFPSEEQIGKLPPRVRLAFFGWLGGELNPEASGAALIPAPTTGS
jgi:hypothetical protein